MKSTLPFILFLAVVAGNQAPVSIPPTPIT